MRKIRIVLYAFLACLLISTKAYAADKNVIIYDDAELLSSDEYIQLEKYLKTLDSSINYLVVTTSSHDYGDSEDEILYTYYDESFGEKSDGIAFIVDMYDRRIHLSGYGEIQYKIKDADSIDITDNVYRYASKGDYYNCILHVFEQADTLVHEGAILRPMRFAVTFLVSIILGFLLAFFVAIKDRKALIKNTGEMEMLLAGASFVGGATIYDSKKVLRHESNSSGGFSSGSGGSFSGGGGGFSSGGGGGGHSGGGHSF